MRIALVSESFTPAVNGVVNSVRHVVEELAARGHEPIIIAPSGSDYRTRAGRLVEVVRVPSRAVPGHRQMPIARANAQLLPILADLQPHVIHLASPAVLGWAAVRAATELDVPTVAVFQTDLAAFARRYHLGFAAPAIWSRLRRIHNCADLTLVPSSATAYQLRCQSIGPLAIWRRGVDGQRFDPLHRDEVWRFRTAGANLVVGFVGRLAHEKRVHLLEPISRTPRVSLVVVGDGPRRHALERRMPNAVFTGQLTGSDLGRVMASFDLLVNPGADETFCQVVQEALCAGVAVIAAASGGPLDLIRHGENGLLWVGDDPDVLAAQVAALRYNPAQLAHLRAQARASVVGRTWSRMTDELLAHYRRAAVSRRSGSREVQRQAS